MDIQQPTREIKLIVIDLDGTLLSPDHSVSEANKNAVRAAMEAGVQVVLATGKTRYSAESVIAALNLQTPGIFVQGLVICNPDGSIRYQQTLDTSLLRRIISYVEQRGYPMLAYSGNRLLAKNKDEQVMRITTYGEPVPDVVGPLVNIVDNVPVHKLIVAGEPRKLRALRWQLNKLLKGEATITTAGAMPTLEILPAGASKGKSVLVVVRDLGFSMENVMAIGDAENDIDMIKFAGLGVAMGNADPRLKEVANVVVASNEADGVAEAIQRFVLKKAETAEEAHASSAENTTKTEEEES